MKKKRTSCVRLTGLIASAYAAGSPRIKTSSVDPMLATAELMKRGGKSPDSTSWNSVRVGMKKIVGGELAACGSVLRLSSHIHRTGKKNMNTTNQPTTDQTTLETGIRPPTIMLALTVWARPGRSRTSYAAR